MITLLSRRLAAVFVIGAFALIAASCGSDAVTTTAADSDSEQEVSDDEMAGDEMADEMSDEHDHGDVNDPNNVVEATDESVVIEAFADPEGGWNVEITLTNFTVVPDGERSEHIAGEGHMHLLIDGVKQGRVYDDEVFVPDPGPGEHTIQLELNSNDHRPYMRDGEPVSGAVVVTGGEGADAAETDATAATSIMVTVVDGEVTIEANGSDSDRVEVPVGTNVRLMITSDVVEHIHVHGYDLFADLAPGETTVLDFVAEIPGLVEIELEDSGTFLFELSSQ